MGKGGCLCFARNVFLRHNRTRTFLAFRAVLSLREGSLGTFLAFWAFGWLAKFLGADTLAEKNFLNPQNEICFLI